MNEGVDELCDIIDKVVQTNFLYNKLTSSQQEHCCSNSLDILEQNTSIEIVACYGGFGTRDILGKEQGAIKSIDFNYQGDRIVNSIIPKHSLDRPEVVYDCFTGAHKAFVWDVSLPRRPTQELRSDCGLSVVKYLKECSSLEGCIIAGKVNGQISLYDLRQNSNIIVVRSLEEITLPMFHTGFYFS